MPPAAPASTPHAGQDKPSPQKLVEQARECWQRRDLAAALLRFREALQADPAFWPARVGEGEILVEQRQFAAARSIFETLAAERPTAFLPPLRLAVCLRQLEGLAAALPLFEQAWRLEPGNRAAGLAYADALIESRQFEAADALLGELQTREPQQVAVVLARARCARLAHGPQAALPHFEAAMAEAPQDRSLCLAYADALMSLGRSEQAQPMLEALVEREPRQHAVHLALARCRRLREGVSASLAHLREAAALAPADRQVQLTLADALIESGGYAEAEQTLQALRAMAPGFHAAHLSMARLSRLTQGAAAALPHLEAARAAAPQDRAVVLAYGEGLVNAGRLAEAEAVLKPLCEREPGFVTAQLALGRCVRLARGMAEALPYLEAARAAAPMDRWACLAHAEALVELGQHEPALLALQALQTREPGFANVHVLLARSARLRDGVAAALPHLMQAQTLAPQDRSIALSVADSLIELRRFDEAETQLHALLTREPSFAQAAVSMARCLRETRGVAAALPWLARAAGQAPTQTGVQLPHAEALLDLGRHEEAENCLRALVQANPHDVQALLGLGRCVRRRRNADAARPLFEQALALSPDSPAVRMAVAELLLELRDPEAARIYQSIIDADPAAYAAWLGLGRCLAASQGPLAALPALRQANALAPQQRAVVQGLGAGLLAAGEFEAAAQLYADAAVRDAGWPAALLGLARSRHRAGDAAGALQALQDARARLTPGSPQIVELSNLLCDWGHYEELDAVAATAADEAPNIQFELTRCRARALSQQGRHRDAIALLSAALDKATVPQQRELRLVMAAEQRQLGEFTAALQTLDAVEAEGELPAHVHVQRCEIARERKDYAAARMHLLKAVEARPQPPAVPGLMAQLFADTGHPEVALRLLADLCKAQPGQFDWARRRCAVLRRCGRLDEAVEAVGDLLQRFPGHSGALHEAFAVAMAAGDLAAAAAVLPQFRPASASERALVESLYGALAEARWDHAAMAAHYEAALAHRPGVGHYHFALATRHLLDFNLSRAREHLVALAAIEAPRRWQEGLSSNVSQSHLGQLLDEYQLDGALAQQLQVWSRQPPQARIDAILQTRDDHADSTALATALTIALRQHGHFGLQATSRMTMRTQSAIPSRLTQYWDSEQLPPEIAGYMQSWVDMNPGFAYQRFSDERAQSWLAAHHPPRVLAAYCKAAEPAMKADYFRLALLSIEGGFYLDADDRCRRPLRDWVPPHAEFVGYQENYGTLGNNFIGVVPAHPVIVLALRLATEAIERGDEDLLWLATGPALLTRAYAAVLASLGDAYAALVRRTVLVTQTELGRYIAVHCQAAYKDTTRHWSRAAFNNSAPRPAPASNRP